MARRLARCSRCRWRVSRFIRCWLIPAFIFTFVATHVYVFMAAKFEPEVSGGVGATVQTQPPTDVAAVQGKEIFEGQSCNACHGDGGIGTPRLPA